MADGVIVEVHWWRSYRDVDEGIEFYRQLKAVSKVERAAVEQPPHYSFRQGTA